MHKEVKRFRNGKPAPPPILEFKPAPDFTLMNHPELEKIRYYEKEKQKWIEGVGDYYTYNGRRIREIPGLFYFATMECFVKHRAGKKVGKIERFAPTDFALQACRDIQNDKDDHRIGLNVKGRGLGLTTIKLGVLPNYIWMISPGADIIFTTTDQKTMGSLFSNKLIEPGESMSRAVIDYRPITEGGNIFRKNESETDASLVMQLNYKGADNKVRTIKSRLICKDTTSQPKKAAAFSGQGAAMVEIDDGCLHPYLTKLIGSVSNTLVDPNTGVIDAYFGVGGTIEDTLTPTQLMDIYNLRQKADSLNMNFHFYPCYLGKECVNGHSDIEYYREVWERELQKRKDSGNEALEKAFLKNNPWTENDVWDLAGNSNFEEDVLDHVKEQLSRVSKMVLPISKTNLIRNENTITQIRSQNPSNNHYHILEPPKPMTFYVLTLDGIASGTDTGDVSGSDAVIIVNKLSDPMAEEKNGIPAMEYAPVAWWCHRPRKVLDTYNAALNFWVYYNQYAFPGKDMCRPISAEANAATADHFSTFLKSAGYPQCILYNMKKKPFYPATDELREKEYLRANEFLPKYVQYNFCLPLLQALLQGKSDWLDSYLMFFAPGALPLDYDTKKEKGTFKTRVKVRYVTSGGVRRKVLQEVIQYNNPAGSLTDGYVDNRRGGSGDDEELKFTQY